MRHDLAESYRENKFRFEFKTFGERNKAQKILDRAGLDYELVEDLRPFVVKLSEYSKYAPLPNFLTKHHSTVVYLKGAAAIKEGKANAPEQLEVIRVILTSTL